MKAATDLRGLGLGAMALVAVLLWPGTALADDYEVLLYDPSGNPPVQGLGTFTYTHDGSQQRSEPPTAAGILTTSRRYVFGTRGNSLLLPTAQEFDTADGLTVEVREVDFEDQKDPQNRISGFYVEGLTGKLTGTAVGGDFDGQPIEIEFFTTFDGGAANRSPWERTWTMTIGTAGLTVSGTYGIQNVTRSAAPAPATLLLVLAGLGILAARRFSQGRH